MMNRWVWIACIIFWAVVLWRADAATITITDVDDNSLYQIPFSGRSPGVLPIVSGTYTGTPSSISAMVIDAATGAEVVGWAVIDASPSGGVYSSTIPGVPRGGPYKTIVKTTYTNDTVIGITQWSVGEWIACFGQSNIAHHERYPTVLYSDIKNRKNVGGVEERLNSSWPLAGTSTWNGYLPLSITKTINDSTGYPVGICGYSEGGTSMLSGTRYWAKRISANPFNDTTLYGKLITSMNITKPNSIVMVQGEADYTATTQQYLDSCRSLFEHIKTDLGYMPYVYIVQTREQGGGSDYLTDVSQWITIPIAHDSLCNDTSIFKAASTYQLTTYDGTHYDSTSMWGLGVLVGRVISKKLNGTMQTGYRFKIDSCKAISQGVIRVYTTKPNGISISSVAPNLFAYTDNTYNKTPLAAAEIVDSSKFDLFVPGRKFYGNGTISYDRYRLPLYGRGPGVYCGQLPLEVSR
jgi:hypothetical protein